MKSMSNAECQMPNEPAGDGRPVCCHAPWWLLVIIFVALFAVAIPLDMPLAKAASGDESGLASFLKDHRTFTWIWRFPGNFFFAALAATHLLAYRWFDRDVLKRRIWRGPAILIISGILSGLNTVGKWAFGFYRPYQGFARWDPHWFRGGWRGLVFNTSNLGFPSGDATMTFAAAFSLAIIMPRLRWLWFALAISVSIERICENAHYPTDVVAGAFLGWCCALAARKITDTWLVRPWTQLDEMAAAKTPGDIGGKQ